MEKFKNVKAIIIGVVVVAVIAVGGTAFVLANKAEDNVTATATENKNTTSKQTADKAASSATNKKTNNMKDRIIIVSPMTSSKCFRG